MSFDTFSIITSALVFFIYGTSCLISLIFTFFLDTYRIIDAAVKIDIIPSCVITPLERNIDIIDVWLIEHNKIAGPFMIILSLIDMKLFLDMINKS
jgi:hypothetical protein